jgi:hypothetical protein
MRRWKTVGRLQVATCETTAANPGGDFTEAVAEVREEEDWSGEVHRFLVAAV